MSFLKKLFGPSKAELEASISSLGKRVEELTSERDQLLERVRSYNEKEQKIKETKEGKDPWFQLSSEGFDPSKGVKLAVDWNDALIDHLNDLEISGPTEEAAVQRWLAIINLSIIEQLENVAMEKDDRGTVKDVVKDY